MNEPPLVGPLRCALYGLYIRLHRIVVFRPIGQQECECVSMVSRVSEAFSLRRSFESKSVVP